MSNLNEATTGANLVARDTARVTNRHGALLRDRLTIFRMLVIVTTIAIGIVVYGPERANQRIDSVDWWREQATSFVIGLSMAGPVFALSRSRKYRLGAGGLLALTLGLGCLVLFPPAAYMRFQRGQVGNTSIFCLYNCLPLMALWFLAAMLAGGRISRRSFSLATPFSERYGLLLAILWSPLGLWLMWDFYRQAFF